MAYSREKKMENSYYGICKQVKAIDKLDEMVNNIKIKGFHIIEGFFEKSFCEKIKELSINLNIKQNQKFNEFKLKSIGEDNQIRLPMVHDKLFFEIINSMKFQKILKKLFSDTGSFYVLNQQNIILNKPQKSHNQSKWHRDFPYFSGIMPYGSAFSIIITLSEFNSNNGGTKILPYSRNMEILPSWDFITNEYFNRMQSWLINNI